MKKKSTSKKDYSKVKTKLEEMKITLLQRLDHAKEAENLSSDRSSGDSLDEASRMQNVELTYVLSGRDRHELHAIEDALERIDDGRYGMCEECAGPIEPKRLEILPFAVLCVACQEKRETQQKRT